MINLKKISGELCDGEFLQTEYNMDLQSEGGRSRLSFGEGSCMNLVMSYLEHSVESCQL